MKIDPIESAEEHTRALKRLEELRGADAGSSAGDELVHLIAAVAAYEEAHSPIEEPGDDATDAARTERDIQEFNRLSGHGDARGYKFNRDDVYERR